MLSLILLSSSSMFLPSLSSQLQKVYQYYNTTIPPGGYASVNFTAVNRSYLFTLAQLSSPANMYLMNESAFSQWRKVVVGQPPSNAPSANVVAFRMGGLAEATALEGSGVINIYRNASVSAMPVNMSVSYNSLTYSSVSNGLLMPPGRYFMVIDNTNGSASSSNSVVAVVAYLPPFDNKTFYGSAFKPIQSSLQDAAMVALAFFILFAAGLAAVIYGLIKKEKGPDGKPIEKKGDEPSQEEVDRLYAGVGKKGPKAVKRAR